MPKKNNTIISILNWNNATATISCIESLNKAGYLCNDEIQVYLVDNASSDNDVIQLERFIENKNIIFLKNIENTGFAGGHNQIINIAIEAKASFIWLLNNDATIETGTLETLLKIMKNEPRCGACSPVFAYEDTKKVYFAGAVQNWSSLSSTWCPPPWDDAYHLKHKNNLWLTGTALLLRIKALLDVGLLNEELFAYCEDDDIGERLRLKNWSSLITRDAITYHGPAPVNEVKRPAYFYYLTARNHTHFYLKYTPISYRQFIRTRLVIHSIHRSDLLAVAGRSDLSHAILAGLQDGLTNKLGKPTPDKQFVLWFKLLVFIARGINHLHNLIKK
jgi:GT2 family glycosyltransferase